MTTATIATGALATVLSSAPAALTVCAGVLAVAAVVYVVAIVAFKTSPRETPFSLILMPVIGLTIMGAALMRIYSLYVQNGSFFNAGDAQAIAAAQQAANMHAQTASFAHQQAVDMHMQAAQQAQAAFEQQQQAAIQQAFFNPAFP